MLFLMPSVPSEETRPTAVWGTWNSPSPNGCDWKVNKTTQPASCEGDPSTMLTSRRGGGADCTVPVAAGPAKCSSRPTPPPRRAPRQAPQHPPPRCTQLGKGQPGAPGGPAVEGPGLARPHSVGVGTRGGTRPGSPFTDQSERGPSPPHPPTTTSTVCSSIPLLPTTPELDR